MPEGVELGIPAEALQGRVFPGCRWGRASGVIFVSLAVTIVASMVIALILEPVPQNHTDLVVWSVLFLGLSGAFLAYSTRAQRNMRVVVSEAGVLSYDWRGRAHFIPRGQIRVLVLTSVGGKHLELRSSGDDEYGERWSIALDMKPTAWGPSPEAWPGLIDEITNSYGLSVKRGSFMHIRWLSPEAAKKEDWPFSAER